MQAFTSPGLAVNVPEPSGALLPPGEPVTGTARSPYAGSGIKMDDPLP